MADTCWVASKANDGTFTGFKQIVDWPEVVERYCAAGRVVVEETDGKWAEKKAATPKTTGSGGSTGGNG